jgi:hypothetical protein
LYSHPQAELTGPPLPPSGLCCDCYDIRKVIQRVTGEIGFAALHRNAIAIIVKAARVMTPVHIILSLLCGAQKR